ALGSRRRRRSEGHCETPGERMVIRQGAVVWVDFGQPTGSAPGYQHPAMVLQCDSFNASAINTLVVVLITSTLRLEHIPGNIRLAKGEANLFKPSVVNVTQIATIDRQQVAGKIGTVSRRRVLEVIAGVGVMMGADELVD